MAMRHVVTAQSAVPGMVLGRARLERPGEVRVDKRPLPEHAVEAELGQLDDAIAAAAGDLADLQEKLQHSPLDNIGEFIAAHKMLLQDPELRARLRRAIRDRHIHASHALALEGEALRASFAAIDDPYLRARQEDVEQVIQRLQQALQRHIGSEEKKLAGRVGEILVSDSIAPGALAHLVEQGLLGVVLTAGSPWSHSAILARSVGLPLLTGAQEALAEIKDGDLVLLDGEAERVIVHPTAQDLVAFRSWQRRAAESARRLAGLRHQPSRTADGTHIRLHANAEQTDDIDRARQLGCAGIGLFRTEFLFLRRDGYPDEDEQFEAYRSAVLAMGGRPVTIRTLDIGADKVDRGGLAWRAEANPALGVRGVRLSLRRPTVFKTQLRALLRAAWYGPLRILVPMITSVDEIRAVRSLLGLCREELLAEGELVPDGADLGAMIEVPAAALGIRALLAACDFVAIGTNDLAQYVLAVDRNHDALQELYNPLHPPLLRLVASVIACARRAGKPASLCGEMAGDPALTPLLLALGLTEFSMHPGQILPVRERLAGLDRAALRRLAPRLLRAAAQEDVRALLDGLGSAP